MAWRSGRRTAGGPHRWRRRQGARRADAPQSARKDIAVAWKKLAGLPGVARRVPARTAADVKINTLTKAVTDAKAAADQVLNNTASVEALRSNEWALRFQVAGEDPTVQTAELEEAQPTVDRINRMKFPVTNGVPIGKLFPSQRAQALLFSTFLNSPRGVFKGVPRAITAFKAEKVAAAGATPAKADWQAFVWSQADARWTRLFTQANQERLEALAEEAPPLHVRPHAPQGHPEPPVSDLTAPRCSLDLIHLNSSRTRFLSTHRCWTWRVWRILPPRCLQPSAWSTSRGQFRPMFCLPVLAHGAPVAAWPGKPGDRANCQEPMASLARIAPGKSRSSHVDRRRWTCAPYNEIVCSSLQKATHRRSLRDRSC